MISIILNHSLHLGLNEENDQLPAMRMGGGMSTWNSSKRFSSSHGLIVVILALLIPWTANAENSSRFQIFESANPNCDIEVRGTFMSGIAQHFEQFWNSIPHEENGYPLLVVCLDSPGGNTREGVNLFRFFWETGIPTAVYPGGRCESACAIAFMGGSTVREGWGRREIVRTLNSESILGFHAPSLSLDATATYSGADINEAFQLAVEASGYIARLSGLEEQGFQPISPFHLSIILGTPAERMWYPESLADVTFLDISLSGTSFPDQITISEIENVCDLTFARYSDARNRNFGEPAARTVTNIRATRRGQSLHIDPTNLERLWVEGENLRGLISGYHSLDIRGGHHACEVVVNRRHLFEDSESLFVSISIAQRGSLQQVYDFSRRAFIDAFPVHEFVVPAYYLNSPVSSLTEIQSRAFPNSGNGLPSAGCYLASTRALVTNVQEYVNLRRRPDFLSPIVRRVPLDEQVHAMRTDNITVIGQERDRQACISACQAFSSNPDDPSSREGAQQCISDNMLWYEVTDARGNRGWVSRRFLEEVE